MKKIYIFSLSLILSILFGSSVYGIESEKIPLTLEIENNSNQSSTDRFYFEMVPEDKLNPMPEGTENDKFIITMDKSGTYQIDSMEFDEVGDYVYRVYQVNNGNQLYDYDDSVYTIIVSVINNEDMTDLEAYCVITKDENVDEKYDKIVFENTYIPPSVTDVDTSDMNVIFYVFLVILSWIIFKIVIKKRKIIN